jgi:hypothetical protein
LVQEQYCLFQKVIKTRWKVWAVGLIMVSSCRLVPEIWSYCGTQPIYSQMESQRRWHCISVFDPVHELMLKEASPTSPTRELLLKNTPGSDLLERMPVIWGLLKLNSRLFLWQKELDSSILFKKAGMRVEEY